jgi:hypothetical protein
VNIKPNKNKTGEVYSDRSRRLGLRAGSLDKKPKMNTRRKMATTTLTTILRVNIKI